MILAFFRSRKELGARIRQFIDNIQNGELERKNGCIFRPKLGIYFVQDSDDDIPKMQNYAVMAYAQAKKDSGISYRIYNDRMRLQQLDQKQLEDEMEQACKDKEFIMCYQPKYNAVTRRMTGAEALVRWKKADGTLLPPGRFVPAAEKNGFIVNRATILQSLCLRKSLQDC